MINDVKELETLLKKLSVSSNFKKILESVIVEVEQIKRKNKKVKILKKINESNVVSQQDLYSELTKINSNLEKIIILLSKDEVNKAE